MLEKHSFQEVIKQKKRMCNSVLCCKCDIYRLCGEDLSKCPCFIINNPKKAEEVIMAWAAEHPEPVYPTWIEWLYTVIPQLKNGRTNSALAIFVLEQERIPADTAQKLGIEPKEDV